MSKGTPGIHASGVGFDGFYCGGGLCQQRESPESGGKGFYRCFRRHGTGGSGNKLYRQRSFLYSRYGIFAFINALVLIATLFFVPSMPVKEKLSYGEQLHVLKRKITWYSIAAVTLINGALFGFFSYLSDYLKTVTEVPYRIISILLLVYGLANIIGNIIAGKQLSANPLRSMLVAPLVLIALYLCIFIWGGGLLIMTVIIFLLGVLAGYSQNTMQYMITDAAPEAPDFANGLYLLSANLGTTVGAAVCGVFITFFDTRYSVVGSLLFLAVSMVFVLLRIRVLHPCKPVKLIR